MMIKSLLAATALVVVATAAQAESFSFVALGDAPYGKPEEVYGSYQSLISVINSTKPAFSIHIGDIKSGSTVCSDELITQQRTFLDSFEPALVYTPGDNEWTDCHREKAGKFDPIERLAFLRKTFFADPSKTRGTAPLTVESQAVAMADKFSAYPENARFMKDGVLFVTAHVIGSNNNFEIRDPKAVEEFFARDAADVAWVKSSFEKAKADNAAAVVVAFQADMFSEDFHASEESFSTQSGFGRFAKALTAGAADFQKPVLIVFGDSHEFTVKRPFPKTAPNITAVEVFGDGNINAVEVMVDTSKPAVFGFRPVLDPAHTH